jgi:hypothetical protein
MASEGSGSVSSTGDISSSSPPTAPHQSFRMASVVRPDTAIVDSHKSPSPLASLPQSHIEVLDMSNSSDNFTHHIYERARPPSTKPSRRAILRLFIVFLITFTSAVLLQAVGYVLIVHWRLPSPSHVESHPPLPIVSHSIRCHFFLYTYAYISLQVVRPSIGLIEPYVQRSTRYRHTIAPSATSTPFALAVR